MLFEQKNDFLILTQAFNQNEALDAISTSNVLLYLAGRLNRPIIHFWTLEDTVILGHMDAKLKSLNDGLSVLKNHQYQPVIRNAGGLGVVSDQGIINISFYFPNQTDVSINAAYEATTKLTQKVFAPFGLDIKTGEIEQSYCPGTYDLSVNGRKISGQAQRRSKNNIAVMLYLSLTGDQQARGQMMHDFYTVGNVPKHPKLHFPNVEPNTMVNVNDLIKNPISETELKDLYIDQLLNEEHQVDVVDLADIIDTQFAEDFERDFALINKRMVDLNND